MLWPPPSPRRNLTSCPTTAFWNPLLSKTSTLCRTSKQSQHWLELGSHLGKRPDLVWEQALALPVGRTGIYNSSRKIMFSCLLCTGYWLKNHTPHFCTDARVKNVEQIHPQPPMSLLWHLRFSQCWILSSGKTWGCLMRIPTKQPLRTVTMGKRHRIGDNQKALLTLRKQKTTIFLTLLRKPGHVRALSKKLLI